MFGNSGGSFNTTFVTVLSVKNFAYFIGITSFNTTFVTVLYIPSCLVDWNNASFNTTFVTVLSAFLLVSYFIISQDIP